MRIIDADALIEKWYEVNNIGPEDRGARFIGYTEIWYRGMECAQDIVEELPSADAVQGWIPVSERLPSEDGCYLVSTTGTNNDIIDIAYYTEEIWHKASRIKAWMPLPKPYKEDSEE